MLKGTFDVKGSIPEVRDPRVHFIKGWFQNTWPQLSSQIQSRRDNLIVHFDADLYSSTLFALSKMDSLGMTYTAIFDEFAGHEARALYNYMQSYNAKVTFLTKINEWGISSSRNVPDYASICHAIVLTQVPRRQFPESGFVLATERAASSRRTPLTRLIKRISERAGFAFARSPRWTVLSTS